VQEKGFTLIELVVVAVIVAILAAIALPSYLSYVMKSRAKSATSDLTSLSLVMENDFQKTLVYPSYSGTTIAALPASRTGTVATDFGTWAPSQGQYFTYTVSSPYIDPISNTSVGYLLTATGTGNMNCTLTLTSANTRNATGSSCGFTTW